MTAVSEDATADLNRRISELERRLESALIERDVAIERQTANALVNFRLQNELRAAHERQNASAEILRAIARLSDDADQLLHLIAETTSRLFGAPSVTMLMVEGENWGTTINFGASSERVRARVATERPPFGGDNLPGAVLRENRQIHIPDLDRIEPAMAHWPVTAARAEGTRTVAAAPLRREGKPIGVLIVYRDRLAPFTDEELALQQSFADQAVIAIENARLFNETKETLERQTATADILKVIASSPSDTTPVFEAIASSANRLLAGFSTAVFRLSDDTVYLASFTPTHPAADEALKADFPKPVDEFEPIRLTQPGEPFAIPDTEEIPYIPIREIARLHGFRSMLFVPLMNAGLPIGVISVTRAEPGAFAPHHVQLLQTFADQAVIAIENTRLFNEVQARTRDLTESLQQQTATSEVLQIISSSPSDLAPVFDKMLENATRVCGAEFGSMHLVEGDTLRQAALYNAPPAFAAVRTNMVRKVHPRSTIADAIRTKQVIHAEDLRNTPAYLERSPSSLELADLGGARTVVVVPMLREDEVIGVITVYRQEVSLFGEKQIELLTNFARQAVIAIENARLLRELRQRTDDLSESLQFQTASAEVLKVISRSPDTLQPVLDVIVDTSRELCSALTSVIFLLRDGQFRHAADSVDPSFQKPEYIETFRTKPISPNQTGSILARATSEKRTVHISNTEDDPEFGLGGPLDSGGPKALLCVPLLLDGRIIGAITLRQSHLSPFTERQIEAVESFADQAVIAISNVNLFEQVQQRTRELAKSLEDLHTAQDRLVQTEKLASLGQLTAGIAHEIKNPLNFVNNFAALSAELTDELKDALKPAALDESIRTEVDELTSTLKDNLSKVVQHGKRADSIVKNMLLHSREGSGEHRPTDINALVDESLNLAYHGARAEKPQFNVTLRRDFDPEAGMIEAFPQEITRVFLNLISNGFYAVSKRKADGGDSDFEPIVSATTKGRTDHVEIRIRDNGTGIPADVKEKMFNPFFTTKPAGEGTGLGLSMSHDIIVKQHGGTIDVDTLEGEFTEFTIVLPRTSNFSNKSRG